MLLLVGMCCVWCHELCFKVAGIDLEILEMRSVVRDLASRARAASAVHEKFPDG